MTLRDELQQTLGTTYTLERELGGGGMSRVFVAEERALGRKVVVKVLPPEIAAGVNVDRFKREIQMAARLQHPHIVPVQYLPAAHKRIGELYEARGDREKALTHYLKFVDLWKNADPELQLRVAEVRARITRLNRERR